jgi:hypothetical protein
MEDLLFVVAVLGYGYSGAEEGDATYTSSYCERGRQSPEGAQRSEERAEWSTRACAG